jgi:D-methionine transport system substrate-binding protein
MLQKTSTARLSGVILAATVLLTACNDNSKNPDKAVETKQITVGFGPSTYVDQFKFGIKPYLEKKGYTVNIKIFSQNTQIDPALKEGALNATVHQSIAYMDDMNEKLDLDMIKWADTPSAPQTLRSLKHRTLEGIKDGAVVAVPNDPVNEERAIRLLEQLGWVKVKANAGTATFSLSSVEPGNYNLQIKELDSAQGLRALQDVDYAVVNGNFVASAGERISDGLVIEKTPAQHVVMVTIRARDQGTQWAKDLREAYQSEEFEQYIKSQDVYRDFIFPPAWTH